MSMTTQELIAEVRKHAIENYEKGWDTLVECYGDEDIAEIIGKSTTVRGAIAKCVKHNNIVNGYAAEIRSTEF